MKTRSATYSLLSIASLGCLLVAGCSKAPEPQPLVPSKKPSQIKLPISGGARSPAATTTAPTPPPAPTPPK